MNAPLSAFVGIMKLILLSIFPGARIMLYNVPLALEKAASLFNILLGTACPSLIIFGSNLVIIFTLNRAKLERMKLKSKESGITGSKVKDNQLTVMLLLVSTAYIITTVPYRTTDPIFEMPEVAAVYDMTQQYWKLRYIIWLYATFNIWFYNYAVNFYLYCVGGGKRYRIDTVEVISSLCRPCTNRQ
jgi:hypothetical protein